MFYWSKSLQHGTEPHYITEHDLLLILNPAETVSAAAGRLGDAPPRPDEVERNEGDPGATVFNPDYRRRPRLPRSPARHHGAARLPHHARVVRRGSARHCPRGGRPLGPPRHAHADADGIGNAAAAKASTRHAALH